MKEYHDNMDAEGLIAAVRTTLRTMKDGASTALAFHNVEHHAAAELVSEARDSYQICVGPDSEDRSRWLTRFGSALVEVMEVTGSGDDHYVCSVQVGIRRFASKDNARSVFRQEFPIIQAREVREAIKGFLDNPAARVVLFKVIAECAPPPGATPT